MIDTKCEPKGACAAHVLCMRCFRCAAHCVCPPANMWATQPQIDKHKAMAARRVRLQCR